MINDFSGEVTSLPSKVTVPRICWWFALALLVVAIGLRCYFLLATGNLQDVVEYFYDDGYYYLAVAANIADTGRSTFDGVTLTNGYQPLWLLVLTALAKISGTAPRTFFNAACVLVDCIAIAAVALGGGRLNRSTRYPALCLGVGLAAIVLRWPLVFIQGLEPILLLPLAMFLLVSLEQLTEERQLYGLSALLALAFLIRLDCLAVYATTLAVLLFGGQLRPVWCRGNVQRKFAIALKLSSFVLPTLIAYLLLNQWLFDSAVPVSGLAKSIGGPKFSNWGVAATFLGPAKDAMFLVAVLLLLEWVTRLVARPAPLFYRSLAVAGSAAALQCLYFCVAYTWYVMPWYECLIMVVAALMIARIVYLSSIIITHSPARLVALVALIAIGGWMALWAAKLVDSSLSVERRGALRRALGMGDARIADIKTFNQVSVAMLADFFDARRHTWVAMGDRAGGIGFWGRRTLSVVQLEGLMLDRGYIRALQNGRGREYVEKRFPIEYFLLDREVVPVIQDADGASEYVVADPVRGRVTNAPVPTFCFPNSALRYAARYTTFTGVDTRMAFSFADRIPCSEQALAMMRRLELGIGLQQYSLPSEYDTGGGFASAALENRDRHARP